MAPNTPGYLHLSDGTVWPDPDDPRELQWQMRYGQPDHSIRVGAASVLAAYAQLLGLSRRERESKIRMIREALSVSRKPPTVEQLAAMSMEQRTVWFLANPLPDQDPAVRPEFVGESRARFVDTIVRRDAEQAASGDGVR